MIRTEADFKRCLEAQKGVLFYFATQSCSVGEALEPKVKELLSEKYPKLKYRFVDMNMAKELSAALQVFVEPTLLLFVEGKEYIRKSRHIGLMELDEALRRLYALAFED